MESEKKKILLVHKDDELYEYVSQHLGRDGYRILRVSDGEEAAMLLLSNEVAVIVADAKTDKLNSLDLLDFVTTHHEDLPFIVLAEDGTMDVVAQAIKKGAYDYLKSPFDGYDLVNTVRKAVDYRVEREEHAEKLSEKMKERSAQESQNELRSLLTNILPTILFPAPQGMRTRFVKEMCDNIENLYCDKYISKTEEVDSERVAEVVQLVFNQLGADFKTVKASSSRVVMEASVCPWGEEAKRNPVFCMLTRAIISRIAVRCRSCAMVNLERTIGKGDDKCVIRIENL
ncbi:MAG: methanogen output domain 1-containing protein [Methanobacteriota archaeon]|nr:MAG: methanogen output domain 1-containing protein [Euryarchaeota archaeon]